LGAIVAVEEIGRGEPLVLIHGLATTRRIWATVAPELARKRRVVMLDVPGFGESPPAGAGFELEAVAARIAGALSDHAPFDLVGHSLGGGLALTLAARHPESVKRLVLVAPAGLTALPRAASTLLAATSEPLLAVRRRLAGLSRSPWGRRLLLSLAVADAAELSPAQARLIIEASATARRASAALATITRSELRPLLARLRAPLGLIWGMADRTVPSRSAELVRAARPDVELVLVPQAGHLLMIERPEAFTDAVDDLLRGLST
jgi:pimeloyl-ACP methyl ester carboxylesterase